MTGIVWIASYPKSGSTWLRLALESLMSGGAPVRLNRATQRGQTAPNRNLLESVLGVDTSELLDEEIEELRPRCYEAIARDLKHQVLLKVHDARVSTATGEPLFPASASAGAIYIVRDPRDVAVSYAYHAGIPIDAMIARMANLGHVADATNSAISSQVPQRYLSWSAHVESWLAASDMPVLLLRYEDMIRDFAAELARAAAFLGLAASPETIAGAVAATRFEVLQAAEASEGFGERAPTADRFFRRGVPGGWREELTPVQVKQIQHDHGAVMRRLGYST